MPCSDPNCVCNTQRHRPPADELEEVLRDYFQNDLEGWERGWKAWARRARAVLGVESPHGQARR